MKAYSHRLAEPEPAIALFREHARTHAVRLADDEELRETPPKRSATSGGTRIRPVSRSAPERGIGYEREYATWCGWVANELAAIDPIATNITAGHKRPTPEVDVS